MQNRITDLGPRDRGLPTTFKKIRQGLLVSLRENQKGMGPFKVLMLV